MSYDESFPAAAPALGLTLQSYLHPALEVREMELGGALKKGVFARAPLAQGELVAMWGGVIYGEKELVNLAPELRHYILQVDDRLYIGPPNLDSVDDAEYFNHSCDPNCGLRGQIALVAMRDIQLGEELTFDYAMAESYDQDFLCSCGSEKCRGEILSQDHMLPELRERYRGYFSAWLEKKHQSIPDQEYYLKGFESLGAWGIDTGLDLHECNPDTIRDAEKIREFTVQLCDLIKVKRFGEPVIVHFGEDERVAGYSLVQLIETSLVSGHFANATNRVYLDVFSCAYYDPNEVARFAQEFFEASSCSLNTQLRF